MTNLLLAPVTRSVNAGRRAVHVATKISAPFVGPAARPLMKMTSSARSMVQHAPAIVFGAMEQMTDRIPDAITDQLPARSADVDALEGRITRLEQAAARPAAPKRTASSAAPKRTAAPRAKAEPAPAKASVKRAKA